jgi:sterol desaturase/sphingolipid hydroxylase (fatty acid hydroxylase superfamily)
MRTAARVFGLLLAVLGIAYAGVAIYSLFNADSAAGFLELMKASKNQAFGFGSVQEWRQGVLFNSWLFLGFGVAAAICGAGIAAKKEWARRSWLVASVLVVIFVIVVAAVSGEVWKRYVELLVFAIPSFAVLARSFRSNNGAI